jgi:hypothetical protein
VKKIKEVFMKKLAFLSVTFIFVALLSVASFAQTEEAKKNDSSHLLATWSISISAPGQELPGTFKFEKDGDNYKGAVTTDMGDVPLRNIKVTDNSFTADITANVQGQSIEGTMTGKVEDGKISGEINLAGLGSISYSGKKAETK